MAVPARTDPSVVGSGGGKFGTSDPQGHGRTSPMLSGMARTSRHQHGTSPDAPTGPTVAGRCLHRGLTFVARRLGPHGTLGLPATVGLVVVGLAGWALGSILMDVRHDDGLATLDVPVTAWMVGHRATWVTAVMRAVTTLGSGRVTSGLLITAVLLLARRGQRGLTTVMLFTAAAGTSVLVTVTKLLTTRLRPDVVDMLTAAPGYSFPSGHSAQAAAAYTAIAYLVTLRMPRWNARVGVWTAAVLIMTLVGFSRLYLGVHWLTDVLGGIALGVAWAALVITTITIIGQKLGHHRDSGPARTGEDGSPPP